MAVLVELVPELADLELELELELYSSVPINSGKT
jgi:hypothetical protein